MNVRQRENVTTKDAKSTKMEFGDLYNRVIGCAIGVHRFLGPGLLESAYEQCLAHELSRNGIAFQVQYEQPVHYKDIQLLTYMKLPWSQGRASHQLQFHQVKRWHQAFRTLIPSCSSCPSW